MHARRIILAAVTAAGLAPAVAPAAAHPVAPHAVAPHAAKAHRTFAAAVCDWKGVAPDKCLTSQGGAGNALFNANYDGQTNQDYGFQLPSDTACTNNKVTTTCPFTNTAIDALLAGKSITTIRNNSFGEELVRASALVRKFRLTYPADELARQRRTPPPSPQRSLHYALG
jgi:hypothetical protein